MEKIAERGFGRLIKGVVSSNRMDKTITVDVLNTIKHRTYNKVIKRTRKHYAHDEKNECQIGDVVMIKESRPYSKLKKWRVTEILKKSNE